jgi:hypothetical protein
LEAIEPREREEIMEIVTSWMEEGERAIVLRLLRKRLGGLDQAAESRIGSLSVERLGELGEALLDFDEPGDLAVWLEKHPE